MDLVKLLKAANDNWATRRISLSKADIARLGDKDTFRGRMCGFLTSSYYKRTKLIEQGELYYAYVFQSWDNSNDGNPLRYPTWALFSPSIHVREKPEILYEAVKKINALKESGANDKETKKFLRLIEEPLSDASSVLVPPSIAGSELIYFSIVYVQNHLNPFFHLGLNIIIANLGVSKEVLYLPEDEMPKEFYDVYMNGEMPF